MSTNQALSSTLRGSFFKFFIPLVTSESAHKFFAKTDTFFVAGCFPFEYLFVPSIPYFPANKSWESIPSSSKVYLFIQWALVVILPAKKKLYQFVGRVIFILSSFNISLQTCWVNLRYVNTWIKLSSSSLHNMHMSGPIIPLFLIFSTVKAFWWARIHKNKFIFGSPSLFQILFHL